MTTDDITFDQMLARLAGTALHGIGTPALSVRKNEDFFVPPRFAVTEEEDTSPIILLSARGAAGKTTVANELSNRLKIPVWRLQDDSGVSRSSVHSLLVQHLSVVDPFAHLRSLGSPLLIVDSLDEARSRVSATSWSEFIEALLEGAHNGLRLLLLGRARTLEDLWVSLVDAGTAPAWYEVSHFDSAARIAYVNDRARARRPDTAIDTPAYAEARDAILSALSSPVSGEEHDRFVGYPPVLDAVAQRLVDNRNFISVTNEFASLQATSRTAVLRRILEQLLMREQAKMGPSATDLGLDPSTVYAPREQIRWLLHDLEAGREPDVLPGQPTPVRTDYYERVKVFREDHPFRNDRDWASPVFQAYSVSAEFDDVPTQTALSAGKSSGLLFELTCGDASEDMLLTETQFAALHASLLAGQWQSADASVVINSEDDQLEGAFELRTGATNREIRFILVPGRDDELRLDGPLTNLSVSIESTIRVPTTGEDVALGPDLHLHASTVHIEGSRAVFGRRDDDQGATEVEIRADSLLTLPHMIAPPLPKKGVVEISPPPQSQLSFPWNDYQEHAPAPVKGIDERVVRMLNKIMNLTRSHGHGGDRAVFIKKLQGRQGLPSPQFRAALQCLINFGAVYLDGEMVFVSSEWEKYRYSGKSTPGQPALSDVIDNWRPALEAMTEAVTRCTDRRR